MTTTNQARWNFWMKDFGSPQLFIDWGFYSLISTVLQRRVFLGSDQKALYTNQYTILTGPAGVGKGMVLGEVANILKHTKLKKVANLDLGNTDDLDPTSPEGLKAAAQAHKIAAKNMIIPMAPNATTFQALTRAIAEAASPFVYTNAKGQKQATFQSSLCVHLEEMGSLFRKDTEDIHTLLCELYDCKDEYEYRTKHQGTDLIRKPCVNILAGTTPEFLKRVFSSSLLSEGFASRTVFVVAFKNRFRKFETPVFSPEQIAERELLVDHIAKLTKLVGRAQFTPEALQYCKFIWENPNFDRDRTNPNPRLNPYYARRNITHAKLSAALHFADSLEMEIPIKCVMEANMILNTAEASMHLALQGEGINALTKATDEILKYFMMHGKATKKLLLKTFYDDMPTPYEDIQTILKYLEETNRIQPCNPAGTFEYVKPEEPPQEQK